MNDLPRVTYSNTGEDFSGVHEHLDEIMEETESRIFGKPRPAFIGGQDRLDGVTVDARSPIDRNIVLGEFPQAAAALVDEAVTAARNAFPAWRALGWERRAALLRAGAKVSTANALGIIALGAAGTGAHFEPELLTLMAASGTIAYVLRQWRVENL